MKLIQNREGYNLLIVARREGILYKLKSELESQYHNHIEVFAFDLSKADAAYEVFNYTLEKNIQIGDNEEAPDLGGKAIAELPSEMIKGQTYDVDAISGATITSNGIKDAVARCLEQASN